MCMFCPMGFMENKKRVPYNEKTQHFVQHVLNKCKFSFTYNKQKLLDILSNSFCNIYILQYSIQFDRDQPSKSPDLIA